MPLLARLLRAHGVSSSWRNLRAFCACSWGTWRATLRRGRVPSTDGRDGARPSNLVAAISRVRVEGRKTFVSNSAAAAAAEDLDFSLFSTENQ